MNSRVRIALAALLLAALTSGCEASTGQVLDRWTLRVPGRAERAVRLPAHFDEDVGSEATEYRLVSDVTLDPRYVGRDADVVIPYLPAATRLFIDGSEARAIHETQDPPLYRRVGPHRWFVPAAVTARGTIHVELEITHRWTTSGWVDVPPEVVPAESMTTALTSNHWTNDLGGL